jgi:hypothetical protein
MPTPSTAFDPHKEPGDGTDIWKGSWMQERRRRRMGKGKGKGKQGWWWPETGASSLSEGTHVTEHGRVKGETRGAGRRREWNEGSPAAFLLNSRKSGRDTLLAIGRGAHNSERGEISATWVDHFIINRVIHWVFRKREPTTVSGEKSELIRLISCCNYQPVIHWMFRKRKSTTVCKEKCKPIWLIAL